MFFLKPDWHGGNFSLSSAQVIIRVFTIFSNHLLMQLIREMGRYELNRSLGLPFLCIIFMFDVFQRVGRWLRWSDALNMEWKRLSIFGGQSFSMLLVMLSGPGAPLALHVDRAACISSIVISCAVSIAGLLGG